ncbi:uncharacterized protein LOC107001557 [Solanum pennellii]|uniref:Uncharacterized protein LOC107001557 n=1 Tax=Solanum pennellii TaxID=28526 RepID=A0ABM1FCR3_SOLPN|nr:uncharacterized protein LOC107001557 [Solanum pennellii]
MGASINLTSLGIYEKLGLGMPKPTTIRLMIADRSVKRLVGILCDVLVKVYTIIFPADFVILDCEVDFEVPIILGRPFLATRRALVDVEPEKMIVVETLSAVLINFDADFQFDYGETVNDLEGMGAHYYAPKKIDLDLKSQQNSPAKSSSEEQPVL